MFEEAAYVGLLKDRNLWLRFPGISKVRKRMKRFWRNWKYWQLLFSLRNSWSFMESQWYRGHRGMCKGDTVGLFAYESGSLFEPNLRNFWGGSGKQIWQTFPVFFNFAIHPLNFWYRTNSSHVLIGGSLSNSISPRFSWLISGTRL